MGELNKLVADLDVQFVGIVGGEMRFNRVAQAVTAPREAASPTGAQGQEGPAAGSPSGKAAQATGSKRTDGDLLNEIVERILEHPDLVGQIKGVDSVSLRDSLDSRPPETPATLVPAQV